MNKCNSSLTWSAFSGAPFCASLYTSWSAPLEVYYQVHPNCTIKRTSNPFIFVPFELSCASPGALKSSLFYFFAFISTLRFIFKTILKCVSYTHICNLSYIWGSYLWLSCVVPSRLLTTTLSVLWFTPRYMSFIGICLLEFAGIALCACVK